MARETNCPVCQKLLIGGQCSECGYYVSTHELPEDINDLDATAGHLCESHNGGPKYNRYNTDAGHLCESHNGEPSIRLFSTNERDAVDMTKSDKQLANEKGLFIVGVILTMMFPIWGYIISQVILTAAKTNSRYKKKLTAVFVVMIIIHVIMFAGGTVLSLLGME